MKQGFALLLVCLLAVGCGAAVPETSVASPESSSAQSASQSVPESLPASAAASGDIAASGSAPVASSGSAEDSLTVPLTVCSALDRPEVFVAQTATATRKPGGAEQLARYRSWIDGLRGADIESWYAQLTPAQPFAPTEMSLADSQQLLTLLRQLQPVATDKLPETPDGGRLWELALTVGGKRVLVSGNSWLEVAFADEETVWRFVCKEQNELSAIAALLEKNQKKTPAAQPQELWYKGERVQSLYALDAPHYVVSPLTDPDVARQVLTLLESYQPQDTAPGTQGYLLFTEKGRQYIYLDGTEDAMLTGYSLLYNNSDGAPRKGVGPLHPSWLVHYDPTNLVSANGVTDPKKLAALTAYLKNELCVTPQTRARAGGNNPNMPTTLYTLRMEFASGVSYSLIGYKGDVGFSITASDLDTTVFYELESAAVEAALIRAIEQLG